ncbi:unnamed protein product [Paramecium sonneborni]|uniref:Uncharacterized protein n=1 Tax=Paramecium sonneborni TaxID=65129 RepID=A0A8S1RMZ5_9CILI|nr:unnamed protein product [Paramecium sonneborni]CAD8128193.1 unnamed protein product [Paramecium sonneborni]CAD8128195.1 unnamed protein product [Paramecium sonneborni]
MIFLIFVRAQDLPIVQIVLPFQSKEYSKILEKKQIPYAGCKPQIISTNQLLTQLSNISSVKY